MSLSQKDQTTLQKLGFSVDYDLDDSEVWKHPGNRSMRRVCLYTSGVLQQHEPTCYDGRTAFELAAFLAWWIQISRQKAPPTKKPIRTVKQKLAHPRKGDVVPCRAPHCKVALKFDGTSWQHVAAADRHIPQPKAR